MNLKMKEVLFLFLAIVSVVIVFLSNDWFPRGVQLIVTLSACGVLVLWGLYVFCTTFTPLKSSLETFEKMLSKAEDSSLQHYTNAKAQADRAGQQAASLEEASASLEQITATVAQNAGNADQGRLLIEKAGSIMHRANTTMGEANRAMGEISEASEKISQVIRDIDKIAFQTNLLALNAAVEAARSGEAGDGFAVVADEVRSLAKQSATAAKGTEELIQNTLNKISHGVAMVNQSETEFKEMIDSFDKSVGLIREIAEASAEQRVALKHVAEAVTQIDAATQENAIQAKDSADSYEEMEAQAERLHEASAILQKVLRGTNRKEHAIALVQKGMAMVKKKGLAATIAAAQDKNGPFCHGDEWYIYIGSTNGKVTLLAHPITPETLVGPDLSNVADIKGKTFFHDLIEVAVSEGAGWVNYWWPKPGQTVSAFKSTYVMKVPGEDAYIACGVYV